MKNYYGRTPNPINFNATVNPHLSTKFCIKNNNKITIKIVRKTTDKWEI